VKAWQRVRLAQCAAVAVVLVLLPVAVRAQATKTKKKTIVVAADGSGQFKTVQEAVDSAPGGDVRINIKPGEYRNLISISTNGVELRGLGKTPEDVVLVYDNSAGTPGTDGKQLGTGRSGTMMLTGDDFYAENLTIANDFEKRHERSNQGSQAVALHVTGDREVFRKVRFLGFQDTLYADSKLCHMPPGAPGAAVASPGAAPATCHAARQYYADCYIEGHVDFIFGDAKAVFDRCEIHTMPHVMDTITAQSRLRPEEDSGYVFRDCTVTGAEGSEDILLGRPWRAYSTVVFLNTDFKAPLDPAGWKEWSGALATSDYEEFNSHGLAGDVAKRIAPSKQLTAADIAKYATKTWLDGTDGWDPEKVR
jgi:pectin methylesterase-like acyl-CoA thioesterase